MKIILGAGDTSYDGWIKTQQTELDLCRRESFEHYFSACHENADSFLAEHIWEHMTEDEGACAAKLCYDYLKPGGYIRAAVPDANFRSEWYQNMVKIGGNGDPSHPSYTHKIVYDAVRFKNVFERAGFEVELLEYCTPDGIFHYKYWNDADGHIGRSLRYDTRNSMTKLGMVSIIIDAKKTASISNY